MTYQQMIQQEEENSQNILDEVSESVDLFRENMNGDTWSDLNSSVQSLRTTLHRIELLRELSNKSEVNE